jgi:hypothetical protein
MGNADSAGENRNAVLIGGPHGERPFGKSWHRWESNIKMDVRRNSV